MACICHGAKGIGIVPPRSSHLMLKSFYLLMCVSVVCFPWSIVSTGLLAAELPPNDVDCLSRLAPPESKDCCCLCSEERFKRMGKSPFPSVSVQFQCLPVSSVLAVCLHVFSVSDFFKAERFHLLTLTT